MAASREKTIIGRPQTIARAWADARVQRIYGGTNEIMREVIARSMFGKAE